MKPYTFYLHQARGENPSFEFVACEDDDDARERAKRLFDGCPGLVAVEIFDGCAHRFRIGRPRDAEREHAAGQLGA